MRDKIADLIHEYITDGGTDSIELADAILALEVEGKGVPTNKFVDCPKRKRGGCGMTVVCPPNSTDFCTVPVCRPATIADLTEVKK